MKTKTIVKVRIQGTEEEVEFVRSLFLERFEGLRLGTPREGTNPKYIENQKWASYGEIFFDADKKQIKRQRRKRRTKKLKTA
jgi:hypothetical protein